MLDMEKAARFKGRVQGCVTSAIVMVLSIAAMLGLDVNVCGG